MHLIKAIQPAHGRKKTKRKIVLAAGMMLGGINCGGSSKPTTVRAPSIEAVDPTFGAPGSKLKVEGANLDQGTLVASFAGAETVPVERSAGEAVFVIPEGAKTGELTLVNQGGTSSGVHVRIAVKDERAWQSVAAGSFHTCGVKNDGSGWCWGENASGQLGFRDDAPETYYPREISGTHVWSQLTLGSYLEFGNTCGLDSDGTLWCWGDNGSAQYGNGSIKSWSKPQRGGEVVSGWDSVSLGSFHACGLASGTLYCWGTQKFQIMADGETERYPVEITPPAGEAGWAVVSAGTLHTCAITTPGSSLYCWGDNRGGQLGDGTIEDRPAPVEVLPGTRWTSVSSGSYVSNGNTCGIQEDGSLWCWGDDGYGQVGNAGEGDSTVPVHTGPDIAWRSVSVGGLHVCAIDQQDALWCWGGNQEGQLANGTSKSAQTAPVRVESNLTWDSVAAGGAHTCALTKKGDLYCWGANQGGQLGHYGEENSPTPRKVEHLFKEW